MEKLVTHPELENMLPPLSETEQQGLESDIRERGCLSPIVVWGNCIVDGHFRYAICKKHGIPFKTKEIPFKSLDEAMFWAWQHQENRRNLTPYQRVEIALEYKQHFVTKGKSNMANGGGKNTGVHPKKITTPVNTSEELAKLADVSKNTVARVEYLDKHANEETKQRLRNGETSINREYTRLKEAGKPMLPMPSQMILPKNDVAPDYLDSVVKHIGADQLPNFIYELFGRLYQVKGPKAVSGLLRRLNKVHTIPSISER